MNRLKKSWQIYSEWQAQNLDKIIDGQEIYSFDEFQYIYEGMGRRLSNIKTAVQYQTSYKTFNALKRARKESLIKSGEKNPKIDLATFNRQMSTMELAEFIKDDINEFKRNYRKLNPGASSKQIALAVSQYFFGS